MVSRTVWRAGGLLLAALLVAGCVYSAHSEIVVSRTDIPLDAIYKEIEKLNDMLTLRHDSCFASHRALVERKQGEAQLNLLYRIKDTDIDVEVAVLPQQRVVTVQFDEWMEGSFSRQGRVCYYQLLRVLESVYGKDHLYVVESCKAGKRLGPARPADFCHQISISVPYPTTWPVGTSKNAAVRSALRCKKAKISSRHIHMPGTS